MSEDKLEEKYLGNAKLSQKPERKLVLRLGDNVVGTRNIKNGAVTADKLNEDVKNWLAKQIEDIESGSLFFSQDLGEGESVGISQKALSEIITELRDKLDILEQSDIGIITGWGDVTGAEIGSFTYDPATNTLTVLREITTYDDGGNPHNNIKSVEVPVSSKTLYLRYDTQEWYAPNGDTLVPVGTRRIDISELDTAFTRKDIYNSNVAIYPVVDKEVDWENADIKIGTLTIFVSSDENTITQIFTTDYIPVNGIFSPLAEHSELPKTYYRTSDNWGFTSDVIEFHSFTPWKELSAHIDIDDELNSASDNPVKNSVVTAKFEDVDSILETLQGAEEEVRYFEGYDESEDVTFTEGLYVGRSSNGKIVYMTNYNVFAFKAENQYFTEWNNTDDRVPSNEYNIVDEDTEELTIRKDRSFLLLSEQGGLPFTVDSTLNPESANPIQNRAVAEKFASMEPLVFTYENDSKFEGNIIANLDYSSKYSTFEEAYQAIKDAFREGVSVIFKPQAANVWLHSTFVLTQFEDEDEFCCGTVVGPEGFYSVYFDTTPGYHNNVPLECITFKKEFAFDRDMSMADKSMLLINNTSSSSEGWKANTDGTFLAYNYIDNRLYKLNQKNPSLIGSSTRITPSENIIYVDPEVNKCYRWNGTQMISIGGGSGSNDTNVVNALQSRIEVLENLLELSSTGEGDDKVYNSDKLDTLATKQEIANAGYLTEHQDLSDYVTRQEMTTELEKKADKGHNVVILSYCTTGQGIPAPTASVVNELANKMPHGIYWLNTDTASLYKATVIDKGTNNASINWGDPIPLLAETLYVSREPNKQKMYTLAYTANNGQISWELVEVPFTDLTPTHVTISVKTTPESLSYPSNSTGASFIPRKATVNPALYEPYVSVNVKDRQGNDYELNSLLPAGEYNVTYSLNNDIENVECTPVTYTISVEQYNQPERQYSLKTGNLGSFEPSYSNLTDITSNYIINSVNSVVTPLQQQFDPSLVGSKTIPHIFSAEEAGLTWEYTNPTTGTTYNSEAIFDDDTSVSFSTWGGTASNYKCVNHLGYLNKVALQKALNNDLCLGIKLDRMYPIHTVYYVISSSSKYTPKNVCLNIPRDFVIDGEGTGANAGKAVGGFYNCNPFGPLFYTEHSLNLRYVHTCLYRPDSPIYVGNSKNSTRQYAYRLNPNGENKYIDQLIVEGCVFDGFYLKEDADTLFSDVEKGDTIADVITLVKHGRYSIGFYYSDIPGFESITVNEGKTGGTATVIDHNYINHIVIKGNTFYGTNAISNLPNNYGRVDKTFCIVNNQFLNIEGVGIEWVAGGSNADIISAATCPIYIVENTFKGKNRIVRTTYSGDAAPYHCAIQTQTSAVYIISNTISNFISGVEIIPSRPNKENYYATYDSYNTGYEVYFAGNTVSNIISFRRGLNAFGIFKLKGNGVFGGSYSTTNASEYLQYPSLIREPIRIYHDNDYSIDVPTMKALWAARSTRYEIDEVSQAAQDYESNVLDSLVDSNDLFNIKFNGIAGYLDANLNPIPYNSIAKITITDNTFDAGDGNIIGTGASGEMFFGTEVLIANNDFIANRMPSEGIWQPNYNACIDIRKTWDPTITESYNYQPTICTRFSNYWGDPKYTIEGNSLTIGTSATVSFFCEHYLGDVVALDDKTISGNTINQGSIEYNSRGTRFPEPEVEEEEE